MSSSRSPITRRAATALAFSAPIGFAAAAAIDDEKAKPPEPARGPKDGPAAMEAWWTDLEKDETDATRACSTWPTGATRPSPSSGRR